MEQAQIQHLYHFGLLQISHQPLNAINENLRYKLLKIFEEHQVFIKHESFLYMDINTLANRQKNTQLLEQYLYCIKMSKKYNIKLLSIINLKISKQKSNKIGNIEQKYVKRQKKIKNKKICQKNSQNKLISLTNVLLTLSFTTFEFLQNLYISLMQICNIQAISFLNCPSLIILSLSRNNICSLKSMDKTNFKNLRSIDFLYNKSIRNASSRLKLSIQGNVTPKSKQVALIYNNYSNPYNRTSFLKYQPKNIKVWNMSKGPQFIRDKQIYYKLIREKSKVI